jgi:hypothetical protein
MAKRDTDLFQVMVSQIVQNAWINVVLGKALRVLPQAKLLEPLCNRLHWLHRRLVGGWPNLKRRRNVIPMFPRSHVLLAAIRPRPRSIIRQGGVSVRMFATNDRIA